MDTQPKSPLPAAKWWSSLDEQWQAIFRDSYWYLRALTGLQSL